MARWTLNTPDTVNVGPVVTRVVRRLQLHTASLAHEPCASTHPDLHLRLEPVVGVPGVREEPHVHHIVRALLSVRSLPAEFPHEVAVFSSSVPQLEASSPTPAITEASQCYHKISKTRALNYLSNITAL